MTMPRPLAALAAAALAACISPVDYGAPPAAIDAPDSPGIIDARPDALLANHDEDADGVDDLLDLCPTVYSDSLHLDDDHDGVGNDCDPQHGPPNAIVLFATFSATDRTWTADGAVPWELVDDTLETTALALSAGVTSPQTVSGPVHVTASFLVMERTGNGEVSLSDDYNSGAALGSECYVAQTATQSGGALSTVPTYDGTRQDAETRTVGFPSLRLLPGEQLQLTAQTDRSVATGTPTDQRCSASVSNDKVAIARAHGPAANATHLRIATRNVRVRVYHVIAYSLFY